MNRFEWVNARSAREAVGQATTTVADAMLTPPGRALPVDAAVMKAGGIDMLDLMKENLLTPRRVVHLGALPGLDRIEADRAGLRLGSLTTLATIAGHPLLKGPYRAIADAAGHTATPPIRNTATLGGNLLQRPRCWYFRQEAFHCLKKGGAACFAMDGENQYHAIFGNSTCAMVHPSTLATALVALGARLELTDARGATREVALEQFLVTPEEDVRRENRLKPGELLTAVRIPPRPPTSGSAHIKQGEKESFDWAIGEAAAAIERDGAGRCVRASLVLGAVAPVPWRARAAEQALIGYAITEASAQAAARLALAGARPLSKNPYKVPVMEALVARTILAAAGTERS